MNTPAVKAIPRAERKARKSLPPLDFTPRVVEAAPLHIPFAELSDETCKYECSDSDEPADFTFCGHRSVPDLPYCKLHCSIAYVKPPASKPSLPKRSA